ncbi:MAG: hypothetical protein HOI55_00480 [Candidatus Marinimicrobia bacterium]|nr:hypothetical protein [Candidatus Neomarinimicrobiota bacterium]
MKNIIILSFFILQVGLLKSEPGQLIEYNLQSNMSQEDITLVLWMAGINAEANYSISIYDIKYETEGEGGYIDTLAGLVVFPQSPSEAFPILTYHHGTAVNDANAPSLLGLSVDNQEILFISLMTSPIGYITLFPDYEGLGDPNTFHPYIIGKSYAHSTVNMIRAVKELSWELELANSFQFNDQLHLLGYSEGGYATLAAQREIELYYSDELSITTSSPMAGPYDLGGTMVDYLLSSPGYAQPYYIPYIMISHLWYYEGLDVGLDVYFDPFYADTLGSMFDGTHSGSEINSLLPDDPLDILLPEVLTEFSNNENHFFRVSMEENTLLDWTPQSPTFFYHGMGDDIVPYENAQVAYDTFVANGAPNISLTLFPESAGGHGAVAATCLIAGFEVISDYHAISPKGDLNSDSFITSEDLDILLESIVLEPNVSEFQWWAGDVDSDGSHSVFDLLLTSDSMDE